MWDAVPGNARSWAFTVVPFFLVYERTWTGLEEDLMVDRDECEGVAWSVAGVKATSSATSKRRRARMRRLNTDLSGNAREALRLHF